MKSSKRPCCCKKLITASKSGKCFVWDLTDYHQLMEVALFSTDAIVDFKLGIDGNKIYSFHESCAYLSQGLLNPVSFLPSIRSEFDAVVPRELTSSEMTRYGISPINKD